ncbi:MAG: 1-(5-phosphoribosyl)-5-[(5-phosphoribosylamino) methylideneamino] imidazole-4-carboxamide isomerase [Candidatus Nitrosocaldaceae archaeon]|nr:MAG: 1-(5-phosphoribosyl)-5-[(5-phosphoribosylamino) methylideneamino] imidazole-4-carboxamide isomerase [Candidatus Nitrosocaldaceae archaeon]
MKIIPAIDLMDGKVVRLIKGDPKNKVVYSNDPISTANRLAKYADALHIIDLDATLSLGNNKDVIRSIAKNVGIEIQVGGGIRSIEYAEEMLDYADAIMLGTLAYKDPDAIKYLLKYGKDRIIVAIDHRDGRVMINGWKSSTDIDIINAINNFKSIGIEKFLVTNIDKDGTLEGVDIDTLSKISNLAKIIASGGVASIDDIIKLKKMKIYGVILGKALYDNKIRLEEVRSI